MKTIGFIVNPIAGMGGRVGLKGTDGMVEEAVFLGALPLSGQKAARALDAFKRLEKTADVGLSFLTPPGGMGELIVRSAGFHPYIVEANSSFKATTFKATTSKATAPSTEAIDTIESAKHMMNKGADLILFAGGDGTARDICNAVCDKIPFIGIPAGVKIHSPVFAQTPEKAGELASQYLEGKGLRCVEREVLDIDEEAYRKGQVKTQLYGYLKIPDEQGRLQSRKAGTPLSETASQNLIALSIIDEMQEDIIYLIGPGSTTRPILENLSLPFSLLGVDIICNKKILCKDARERDIIRFVQNKAFKIIITPIGGQGFLFGRGNHQISPQLIHKAGKENIIVAATLQKIGSLKGTPFLVDSGALKTDRGLSGYIRVTTGYRQEMVYPIQ
ncbi:MAG: ATP-NAD kinase family protein [Candidatus Marinimicrobia bacterium]|nr:ATP-NAD kinase family protein [Candidatus Neomarinimicrobiota bacterium]